MEEYEEKWHKNCGGIVVYRENEDRIHRHFDYAGLCLKCFSYPLTEEQIIFKIGDDEFQRYFDEDDTYTNKDGDTVKIRIKKWKIVSKENIPERLEKVERNIYII